MKFLSLLKKKPFCNDIHYFFFLIIIFILSLKYYFFFILLFIYLIFIFKKTKYIIISIISILMIFLIILIKNQIRNYFNYDIYHNAYVIDVIDDNNYEILINLNKFRKKEYNHDKKPGNILKIKIEKEDYYKKYENDFDYDKYLLSNNYVSSSKEINSKKLGNIYNLNTLKYYYLKYLKNNLNDKSYEYVSSLIFAKGEMDDEIKDTYSTLGLSHILAISGLHIIIIFNILSFILLKFFHIYKKKIPLIIIGLYVLFIGCPISALRSYLFILILELNKKEDISYTKLDILSMIGIFLLFYNPYMLYNTGFILSFLVSFILIFMDDFIHDKNKIIRNYKRYFIIFIITIPFVINMNNKISFISLLLSPLLQTFLSYLIIPISLILSICPFFDYVFKYIFIFLNDILLNITKDTFYINVMYFDIYMIIIYYLIIIFLLISLAKRKRRIIYFILLIIYFISIKSINYIEFNPIVTFIDVGQGDGAVIKQNNHIMVIDCFNSYDYLKIKGYDYIDILLISHSDDDHLGDYIDIINRFKVKKIIGSYYDDLIYDKLKNYHNVSYLKAGDEFYFGNNKIKILGPINDYDDPNSVSLVFNININGNKILFTGDCTQKEENDILLKYKNLIDADILKVAHHGSNTSSSDEFLKYVSPNTSIISVSKNNKYHLPNTDIVNKLNKISNVYMTKDCGNIDIYLYKNKYNIKTYR